MEERGAGQDHGVIVGPFGRVAPALLVAVPEVAAGRIADDSLGETLPDGEGEVHLQTGQRRVLTNAVGVVTRFNPYSSFFAAYVLIRAQFFYLHRHFFLFGEFFKICNNILSFFLFAAFF